MVRILNIGRTAFLMLGVWFRTQLNCGVAGKSFIDVPIELFKKNSVLCVEICWELGILWWLILCQCHLYENGIEKLYMSYNFKLPRQLIK